MIRRQVSVFSYESHIRQSTQQRQRIGNVGERDLDLPSELQLVKANLPAARCELFQ